MANITSNSIDKRLLTLYPASMIFRIRSLAFGILACLGWVAAPQSHAQVVVYSLEFKHKDGFNVEFFHGGYVVAPLLGGAGTFLLTAFDEGRRVLDASPGSGNYFLAKKGDKRYNVIAATVGGGATGGTASTGPGGSYIAYGEVGRTLTLQTPTNRLRVRIADTLTGRSLAADDEGGKVKLDGSVGTANFSDLKLKLDEKLTKDYNQRGLSVEEAAAEVTRILNWQGYAEAAAETPSDPETPGTNPTNPTNPTSPTNPNQNGTELNFNNR